MSSLVNLLRRKVLSDDSRISLKAKLRTYFKQLGEDYISSGRDTLLLIRRKPIHSFLWGSAVFGVSYIANACPNKQDYYASLVESAVDLWEVPDFIRNSKSTCYIHKCIQLFFKEQLRYSNFGLFTVIWRDDRTQPCCQYAETSPKDETNNDPDTNLHSSSPPDSTVDDWEVVNEEILYVDCQGLLEDDILTPNSVIRLVDLESTKPLMQIGPAVFEGCYEDTVGTYLFFENCTPALDGSLLSENSAFTSSSRKVEEQTSQNMTSYVTKSSKSLLFQRIFLKAKAE
ncbi:unnamed protein product [Heterobilharzia americana]|nr:unnamed protein product [Heterobilharzia americana]